MRKKDGSLHLCVDYRLLNEKTHPDRHPIPQIQEILENLGGNSWFTVLDQGKACHQGFISVDSRASTTFITPWGLYEWVRITFRPHECSHRFSEVHGRMSRRVEGWYLCTLPWRRVSLQQGFRPAHGGLEKSATATEAVWNQAKAKELQGFQAGQVCYVGRIISEHGYSMNPKEIEAVQAFKWEMPSTVREVRKLMGFLGDYRSYIADFAKTAKPLYELLTKPSMCQIKKAQERKEVLSHKHLHHSQ